MASSNSYQQILDEYPEYITKEQLYQICHISTAGVLFHHHLHSWAAANFA